MAPPPEYDKEPKAPDKNVTTVFSDESKVLYNVGKDQLVSQEPKGAAATGAAEGENNKEVEMLDDGQLRALLDEAITYKCPKDREGKSSLFKELLQEVEQDEVEQAVSARGRRRAPARQDLHSNSLQDLVAALAEPAPRRRAHAHAQPAPPASVSARAIHGGSLPSGVDTSFLLGEEGEEPARGGYLATVRCVNPPPLAERRVSASDAPPADPDALARRSKPAAPMTYTARATLEIGSGSVCSGRAVTTTTASNQVDSAIPFACISSAEVADAPPPAPPAPPPAPPAAPPAPLDAKPLQLSSSYRAVAGLLGSAPPSPPAAPLAAPPAALPLQPRGALAGGFNGLLLSRPGYVSGALSAPDDYKKSLDENGNSVQGFSSALAGAGAGAGAHKKRQRKKSSKNETVIKSHQIDGYQGNRELHELLRFIESDAERARGKLPRKHDDDKGKRRRKERERPAPPRPRAASLEELSRTTLEELTAPPPAPRAAPPAPRAAPPAPRAAPPAPRAAPPDKPAELTDFQTVTKKRRARRRADDPAAHAPRRPRAPSPPSPRSPRAPPSPPSDRSNDSNDDLDSVHSLPAERAPPAAPHASYADIARTRHNIPDLIESCNFYSEAPAPPPPPPPPPPDAEYPALEPRRKPAAPRASPPAPPPAPAPDVLAGRRPPVVLLDEPAPRDLLDVTFGFDVNEQLLGCDLLREAPPAPAPPPPHLHPPAPSAAPAPVPVPVPARHALRYLPPRARPPPAALSRIVHYIASAWEDAVRCGGGGGGGKVRYFSE